MVYECEAFADALSCGDPIVEAPILASFRILDKIREQVGIHYPADDN